MFDVFIIILIKTDLFFLNKKQFKILINNNWSQTMGINPTNGNNQQPWISGDQHDDRQSTSSSETGSLGGHTISTHEGNGETSSTSSASERVRGIMSRMLSFISNLFSRLFRRSGSASSSTSDASSVETLSHRFIGSMKGSPEATRASEKMSAVAKQAPELSDAFSSGESERSDSPSPVDTPEESMPSALDDMQPEGSISEAGVDATESEEEVSTPEAETGATAPEDDVDDVSSETSSLVGDLKRTLSGREEGIQRLSKEIRDRWESKESANPEQYRNTGLLTLSSRLQRVATSFRREQLQASLSGAATDTNRAEEVAEGLWNAANVMAHAHGSGEGLLLLSSVALTGPSLPDNVSVSDYVQHMIDDHMEEEDPDDFVSESLLSFAQTIDDARASGDTATVASMWAALAAAGAETTSGLTTRGASQTFDSFMQSHEDIEWNNQRLDSLQQLSPSVYAQALEILAGDVFFDEES